MADITISSIVGLAAVAAAAPAPQNKRKKIIHAYNP